MPPPAPQLYRCGLSAGAAVAVRYFATQRQRKGLAVAPHCRCPHCARQPPAACRGEWGKKDRKNPSNVFSLEHLRGVFSQNLTVYSNPSALDVRQGSLGNCWFLSALAVVAESPQRIKQMLCDEGAYCKEGVYQVQLCVGGAWTSVLIDDFVPCYPDGR